jgi:hypothetical protein
LGWLIRGLAGIERASEGIIGRCVFLHLCVRWLLNRLGGKRIREWIGPRRWRFRGRASRRHRADRRPWGLIGRLRGLLGVSPRRRHGSCRRASALRCARSAGKGTGRDRRLSSARRLDPFVEHFWAPLPEHLFFPPLRFFIAERCLIPPLLLDGETHLPADRFELEPITPLNPLNGLIDVVGAAGRACLQVGTGLHVHFGLGLAAHAEERHGPKIICPGILNTAFDRLREESMRLEDIPGKVSVHALSVVFHERWRILRRRGHRAQRKDQSKKNTTYHGCTPLTSRSSGIPS